MVGEDQHAVDQYLVSEMEDRAASKRDKEVRYYC
jgi:hypothetical protein